MFNRNSHASFSRLLCFLLALHFLNLSIDPKDPHPDSHPEDLMLNDIETITELIAEVVFEKVNAFGEHEEKDDYDRRAVSVTKLYFSKSPIELTDLTTEVLPSRKFQVTIVRLVQSLFANVSSPPPKAYVHL